MSKNRLDKRKSTKSCTIWLIKHDREVKAEAWDEGYSHLFDAELRGVGSVSLNDNPYRKEDE